MRKLLILLSFASLNVSAQDVIVKKDGSTILSKVLEVNQNDIKYKKHSNKNGPTYTINKSDIISINYENGEKDTFSTNNIDQNSGSETSNLSQRYIRKSADQRNAEIISLYNRQYFPTKQLSNNKKDIKGYMLIFGLQSTSVVSNDEVEITFIREVTDPAKKPKTTFSAYEHVVYNINIRNKTNKTIYIDKGNCFKIMDDGSSYCYFDPSVQMTVNSGTGSGASLNLGSVAGILGVGGAIGQLAGGVNVGGGKSQSLSTTFSQQRVIAIPAHGNKYLSQEKCVLSKETALKYHYQMVEKSESFNFTELCNEEIYSGDNIINMGGTTCTGFRLKEGMVKMGGIITYDENNSPYTRKYIITYSTDEFFNTFSSLNADLFLHELIGCDKLHKKNMYGERTILSDKYIEGLNQFTIEGFYPLD